MFILPDFTKRTMLRNMRRFRWELKDRPISVVAVVVVLFVTWRLLPQSNFVLTDENRIDDLSNWLDDYAGIKLHNAHADAVREVMARTLVRFSSSHRKSRLLGMSNEQLLHIAYTVKELGAGESLQHSPQESMITYSKEQLSPYPRRVWLRDYVHWPKWDKTPVSIPKTESRFAIFVPIAVGDYDRFGAALSQWGKISTVTSSSHKHTLPPAVVLAFAGNFSSDEGVLLKSTFKRLWRRFVDQDDTGPDLHFLSLNQPTLNHYDGAAMSFYQICEIAQRHFSTIALLEMDMMPVTKDWFSKLAIRAENDNCAWWQKGSPSMGDAWGLGEFAVRRDFHLNGNALYAPGCSGFMDYIRRVQRFYPPRAIYKDVGTHCFFVGGCEPGSDTDYNYDAGYDHALYDYRQQPENYVYALNVISKFVYDKSLMNLGGSSLSSFDFDVDESTLLVHTKLALLSRPEQIVTEVWREVVRRDPTVEEIKMLFPLLNSGEFTRDDVIDQVCEISPTAKQHINICVKSKKRSWSERFPGKTYLWNTDFHSSPVSCNLQIYEAAGAVVHSEVDYGNCIFAGTCKNRMRVLGWDDNLGFALKSHTFSDPELLKLAFYNEFKDNEEFLRVDGFLCSHPVANCELFLKFNKPLIVFATTRLEFGRHDKFIDWRAPDWTQVEGERRWRQWIETLIKISKDPKSTIAANSLYDVKYIEYFTGLKAVYLPSWCGDKTDTYWNLCHGKQDPRGNAPATYNPTAGETTILIGAYRTNLERNRFVTPDNPKAQTPDEKFEAHPIIKGLRAAAAKSKKYKFETISKVYPKGYSTGDLGTHPAIVVIPYQVSTMNLFEMYRVGIPLFFPSLKLLSSWYAQHAIMWERQYGQPERLSDVIGSKTTWPDPNDSSVESFEFWVKWADWYTWPHIQLFDSWEELSARLNAMKSADFDAISLNMLRQSEKQKTELVHNWTHVFDKMRNH